MTTPKIRTAKDTSGNRWYINPLTDQKYPSVTSITGMLPKPYLRKWNAKLVAEEAVALLNQPEPFLSAFAAGNPEGAVDFLKGAPWRATKPAIHEGDTLHRVAEDTLLGRRLGVLTPLENAFARNVEALLESIDLEVLHVEETVWDDTHKYAGTFDLSGLLEGEPVYVDWKSNAKGPHGDVALQLSAYAHAGYIFDKAGIQTLNLAAQRGLVFWVRPDRWAIYEVPIGEEVFDYFLSLRHILEWESIENSIIGKPVLEGNA